MSTMNNNSTFDLNRLVRNNVKALRPYSSARDEYVSDGSRKIFLDANENPFENGLNRYPDPQQRTLKEVLSGYKGVRPEQLLLGNGSDEVLDLIFRAFCEPYKDNVISMPPTYGMYSVLAGINAIENREVLLTESLDIDVETTFDQIDEHTKLIFLCSPNNPTANSLKKDQVRRILNQFHGLVVIDEAYIDFSTKESWLKELAAYPNMVITQTFSKAFGMAGIRLGCCYATADIIGVLNKIKPPYNVNELTQKAALERLMDKEAMHREVATVILERKRLEKAMSDIPFIHRIYPSDANFILVTVDDAALRYEQLLQKGIIVRNRSGQPLCQNTLRFTVGTEAENNTLINVLKELE